MLDAAYAGSDEKEKAIALGAMDVVRAYIKEQSELPFSRCSHTHRRPA